MKKWLYIAILAFFAQPSTAQIQTDLSYYEAFPSFENVLQAFFQYNTLDVQKLGYIEFAKKTDGWYIQELQLDNWMEVANSTQIWSAKDTQFNIVYASPDYIVNNGLDSAMNSYAISSILERYNAPYFDIAPVYGYDGYEEDLFAILKDKKELPVELLDIHARAYSQICDKMMLKIPSAKYGKHFEQYFKTLNPSDISEQSVKDYTFYANRGIAIFREISTRFPDFKTIVGNIKIKYWNEHLARYYDLIQLQQPETANKYLQNVLYDDFLVKYGRNMLKGCEQEGILFTHGDLDTYVCLYLQGKYKFRTDVTVVNSSLIGLDYHIDFQRKVNKLPLSLPTQSYINDIKYHISLGNSKDTIRFDRFIHQIKTNPGAFKIGDSEALYTDSRLIGIHVKSALNVALRFGNTAKYNGIIYANFKTAALTRSQFVVLDVISTNQWQRPVYFALGTNLISQVFLNKYLRLEGWVLQLVPRYGVDIDFKKFKESFKDFEFATPAAYLIDETQPNAAYIYSLYLIWQSAQQAKLTENTAQILEVMNTLYQHFPYEKIDYLNYSPYFAHYSYQVGLHKEADFVIIRRAKALKKLMETPDLNPRVLRTYKQEASYLKTISVGSKEVGFSERVQKMLESNGESK